MTEDRKSTMIISLDSGEIDTEWDYDRNPHLLVTGLSETQSASIQHSLQKAAFTKNLGEFFLINSEESLDEVVQLALHKVSDHAPTRFAFVDDIFLTSDHTHYSEYVEKLQFVLRNGRSKNIHVLVATSQVSKLLADVVTNVTVLDENLNQD